MQRSFFVGLIGFFIANSVWASEWPKLEGGDGYPECAKTLEVAKSTFYSKKSRTYLATTPPSIINILDKGEYDISGGDALNGNQPFFEKIAKEDDLDFAPRSIYWQKSTQNHLRFIVDEDSVGWRGDAYTLYVVTEKVGKKEFIKSIAGNKKPEIAKDLIGDMNWRPPMMLKDNNQSDIWAVDVGHPAFPLNKWHVFTIDKNGVEERCEIVFQPEQGAFKLLPYSVRKLADLLDGTLGTGANEGTLNPTAHIRSNVSNMWANIALRPWAVENPIKPWKKNNEEYRQSVDEKLKLWSKQAPSFAEHYRKLIEQYPIAERELVKYYVKEFKKSSEEARALAKQNIEAVYLSYYRFSL